MSQMVAAKVDKHHNHVDDEKDELYCLQRETHLDRLFNGFGGYLAGFKRTKPTGHDVERHPSSNTPPHTPG